MFSGLIEKVGRIERMPRGTGGARVAVSHDPWETPLEAGESVAVQGVCLTVARAEGARFECDVLAETLARSSLGAKTAGAPVNLERALRVGDRVGGHFVAGHVDGTGRVAAVERAGSDWALRVVCDGMLTREMVPKGSVACDGVSLTVTALDADGFTVHVIPFTWTHTTLGRLGTGAAVNIETDMIGKYVRRMLARQGDAGGVDRALLERAGFV